jgi:dTDP-4-dehydrorhamnose reductase
MRILITGGSGLLGQYLNIKLSEKDEILTLYNSNKGNCGRYNSLKCNLRYPGKLSDIFTRFRPDAVVHTACYSRPEICAKLPEEEVYALNVQATESISRLCNENNTRLIYTSTDLVYKSSETGMLTEDSELNPLTLYAQTKLEGESAVRKYSDNHIILRTALLIGFGLEHSRNNFHLTFENLKNGKEVRLFKDQFRTPLSLTEAADFIGKLITSEEKNETINFGGAERVSRYEIGKLMCEECGFDSNLIKEISCRDVAGVPQVPDVSMNTRKLQSLGLVQNSLRENINLMCQKSVSDALKSRAGNRTGNKVEIGRNVLIVQKKDQGSGALTEGIVSRILTKSKSHPRGTKVQLESGEIGRVKEIK